VRTGGGSFLKTLSLEGAKLGARLARATHSVLDTVMQYVPDSSRKKSIKSITASASSVDAAATSIRCDTVNKVDALNALSALDALDGLHEGLRQARDALARGLQSAAQQIVVVPYRQYRRAGAGRAAKVFLRGVPSAVLHPMLAATDALDKILV